MSKTAEKSDDSKDSIAAGTATIIVLCVFLFAFFIAYCILRCCDKENSKDKHEADKLVLNDDTDSNATTVRESEEESSGNGMNKKNIPEVILTYIDS